MQEWVIIDLTLQDYIIDAEELSLDTFIQKYQDDLPLHVRVCKGFYGQSERTSVSEGDTFNVHFIKKAQVWSDWVWRWSIKLRHTPYGI